MAAITSNINYWQCQRMKISKGCNTYPVETGTIYLEIVIQTTSFLQIGKWWQFYQILKHILISILGKLSWITPNCFLLSILFCYSRSLKQKEEPAPTPYLFIKVNLKLLWCSKNNTLWKAFCSRRVSNSRCISIWSPRNCLSIEF